jgi:hypothetical protein
LLHKATSAAPVPDHAAPDHAAPEICPGLYASIVTMQSALAAGAALVALAFAMATFERWLVGRRRHELAWSVSLLLFSLGAGCLLVGAANGWDEWAFRLFFLFGAILNVPFLALGTVYLLGGRRRGDACAVAVSLAGAFAAGVLLVAPLRAPVPVDQLPRGQDVFGVLPRVLAAVASGGGAVVVLGGAVWSAWRFRKGPMLVANLLIAAGTLVLSAGGLLNSVLDEMEAFAVTLVAGITVLFVGFIVATGRRPAPAETAPTTTTPTAARPPATPAAAPSRRVPEAASRRT